MPAGITEKDSMMSVREVPWHGLGAVLKKHPKTVEAAVKAAGLDWEVEQFPIFSRIDGKQVKHEEFVANVRSDTHDALGVVSTRYKPVQNKAAFSFLASIFGTEMLFETAGSLMGGRRVWVLMKLPDNVEIGGDPIGQYAFVSNSHDGNSSVMTALTPVRIVCQNTLTAAVSQAKGVNANRTYRIRHLGNMDAKIQEARHVLQVTVDYYEALKRVGDGLATAKVSDSKMEGYLKQLLPISDAMGDRAIDNRQEAREVIRSIYKGAGTSGDTTGNAPGTYWCLYNAAIEYADWNREERKAGGRWQRSLDDPDAFKADAWKLTIDSAGLKVGSKNKAVAAI